MRKFTFNPLVLAMAACMIPVSAYAQDDSALEEVVVTGSFRDSLANAINIKRNSANAVDGIVADDIASFPDNNLAESMQRIPGVAISRSGGEGRQISVRGLGPDFTRVRINGMEGIATTGGTDATGGNNRARSFDFNTFSSELFTNLAVTKTSSAETDEGSLGATVDLRAARAFDFNDFVFTAGAKGGYNDQSKEVDPQFNFLIGNTFADGKFGALFSYSHSERTIEDTGTSTVRWSNATGERYGFLNGAPITATHEINQAFHPRIPRYDIYKHDLTRDGASLSLQWRPSDATEISLDGLWAKFDATREELFMQGSLNGSQAQSMNVLDYEIQDNTLVYAKTEGARLLSENRYDEMSTDFSQVTLSAKHDFTDSFRINGLIGKSKSDFDNPIQNTVIMQANNQAFTWDYRNGNKSPLDFSGAAALTDPTLWNINSVRQRPQSTLNEYENAQLNFEYDINEQLTVKVGGAYKNFTMETDQWAYANGEGVSCTATPPNTGCGVNIQADPNFIMPYNAGSGLGGTWLLPNRAAIMNHYNLFDEEFVVTRGSAYSVEEDTYSFYAQLDFNFDIGVPVRGNVGVRQFETEQSSSSWVNLSGWQQIYVDHKYDDVLPSLNLVVEPFEDFLIRFGASEGIARAGLGSLKSETSVTVTGTQPAVSAGNPFLKPTKARSYDLGFEWYFAEGALLNVAFFKKEIESHVQGLREGRIYTELGLPIELAVEACNGSPLGYGVNCNENMEWSTSVPLNGPGGDLDGYEISYQQPFSFLPGFWSNFGFIGSYTDVESEMDYLDRNGNVQNTATLLNLSPSSSATIYWENDVFSARVSVANRDGYLTNAIADANANYQNGTNKTTNVDANMSYQLDDNWKFTFEALNLTNEADDQWVESTGQRLSYYHKTGKQYYLGVQYKY
jgi:iron complex outermembrane receptor protein